MQVIESDKIQGVLNDVDNVTLQGWDLPQPRKNLIYCNVHKNQQPQVRIVVCTAQCGTVPPGSSGRSEKTARV